MTTSRVLLFVVIGTSLIAASGCGDPGLWGREPVQVMQDLSAGRHEVLRHIEAGQLNDDAIFALHDGAGYYLGRLFEDLDLPAVARRAYQQQIEGDAEPYRREAVMALLSSPWAETTPRAQPIRGAGAGGEGGAGVGAGGGSGGGGSGGGGSGGGESIVLADIAARAVSWYPGDAQIVRAALERLYALRRYERFMEVLREAGRSGAAAGTAESDAAAAAVAGHPEILLMEAVARHQLGMDGWEALMRRLFADYSARDEHSRLFLYIHNYDEASEEFSPAEHLLFQGKHALVEGRYRDAAEFYRRLLDPGPGEAEDSDENPVPAPRSGSPPTESLLPAPYRKEPLVADMGVAFRLAGYYTVGGRLLEEAGPVLEEPGRSATELARAELFSAGGDRASARRVLEGLLSGEPPGPIARRAFGNYLELLARMEVDQIPFALREHRDMWRAPGAYATFFDNLTADLVRTRDWFVLMALVEIAEANGRRDIAEQYRLVLAAALEQGLFRADPESSFATVREILEPVLDGLRPYYALMAAVMLEEDVPAVLEDMVAGPVPAPADGRAQAARRLAEGYLDFGLVSRAFTLGMEYGRSFPRELTTELARRAAAEGDLIISIRLAGRISTAEYDREVAELRYPLGFSGRVDEVVDTYGLDRTIFYSIIREESHFSPGIVSHAGAVGLAQLMPSTAQDVAQRMRLTEYELTDPATNLSIGGYYLAYLRGRFPGYLHALAAYNGGQGRVRQWLSSFDLEGILFHEAIPLAETRHYVRKIVVSAAYYGYLYDRRSPLETIELIFPDVR
ncbi:MAG: flagellar assembly lytic transglycosylase [bacterium]